MAEQITLAAGSFHFGLKTAPPGGFSEHRYAQEVARALREIPGVDGVEVTWANRPPPRTDTHIVFLNVGGDEVEVGAALPATPWLRPRIPGLRVAFTLSIHETRIRDLLGVEVIGENPEQHPLPDHFRVMAIHTSMDLSPFVLVSPLDSAWPAHDADRWIWVVEGYLADGFQDLNDPLVSFESELQTFPANFVLATDPNRSPGTTIELQGASPLVRFHASDVQAVLNDLVNELEGPVGLFFQITEVRSQLSDLRDEIDSSVRGLTQAQLGRGLRAGVRRAFAGQRRVDEVLVLLAQHRAAVATAQRELTSRLEGVFSHSPLRALRPLLARQLPASEPGDDDMRDLVLLLERRLTARVGYRFLVFSTLLGVGVGAVLSRLLAP